MQSDESFITPLSRRGILAGMTGLALAGVTGFSSKASPATTANPSQTKQLEINVPPRIDVHAHYLTTRYRDEAVAAGHSKPDGMPGLPQWSASQAIESMDRLGIGSALLSISSPGVHFGNKASAVALARSVNEDGAIIVQKYPTRFGLFASLPLPEIEESLHEIEYAYDTLKVDGIIIESNQKGIYPGDERLDPIFAELDKRGATLFIHPTSPNCECCNPSNLNYPRPMLEFMFETTRAIANLILKGTLTKFPNIKIIVPHAGAVIPMLLDRVIALSPVLGLPAPLQRGPTFSLLQNLYFDLAGSPVPYQLGTLLQVADPKKIFYGSDMPFTPEPVAKHLIQVLQETDLLNPALRNAIWRDNALALFPRFGVADETKP